MASPRQIPIPRHVTRTIQELEETEKLAQLEQIRTEMYEYSVSKLNIDSERAKQLGEIAVRAAKRTGC